MKMRCGECQVRTTAFGHLSRSRLIISEEADIGGPVDAVLDGNNDASGHAAHSFVLQPDTLNGIKSPLRSCRISERHESRARLCRAWIADKPVVHIIRVPR